jgi:hypothetical protein
VRRSGLLFKKVQVLDEEGQVVGTYFYCAPFKCPARAETAGTHRSR